MVEVFQRPESMALWVEAGAGRPDWDAIFKDFRSMVDYPGAHYWRELAAYYPDAKVIHSVRDPDEWFDSTQATIFSPQSPAFRAGATLPFFQSFTGDFMAHIHDRAFMTDYFRRHTQNVIAAIPPERLLIFEVGEGWERLCKFLEVPVPDEPFPAQNSRAEFIARLANRAAV
jgi:hypothetical protein